jgi:hypothetical protein
MRSKIAGWTNTRFARFDAVEIVVIVIGVMLVSALAMVF